MVRVQKGWLVAISAAIVGLQFVFFAIPRSSIGTLVYKIMAVSLDMVDQPTMPTLRATREGWPFPTLFGFVLYAAASFGMVFLGLLGGRAIISWKRKNA